MASRNWKYVVAGATMIVPLLGKVILGRKAEKADQAIDGMHSGKTGSLESLIEGACSGLRRFLRR